MRKKRILFCSEATFLNTGYATYTREILNYLYSTDKYELAELGCYAVPEDNRSDSIRWEFYAGALSRNAPEHMHKQYASSPENQFGAFMFHDVCLDFQPDIVCDIRDFWMMEFESRSPYRDFYKWCIMPTVDAEPQAQNWLSVYQSADACLTYSDWAGELLTKQTGGHINYVGSAPPSAHSAYSAVLNKEDSRKKMNLPVDKKIIGTVMRNQRRKLYPDLFATFRMFLDKVSDPENYILYCHTTYPDMGWDIPELIHQYKLYDSVYFTYRCLSTGKCFAKKFSGPSTKSLTTSGKATFPTVSNAPTCEELATVINCFDLYIQYANSEGFGLPQVEAAAGGIPVASVNYSAMETVIKKLEGIPLEPLGFYKEMETGCMRAVPNNHKTSDALISFFEKPFFERKKIGFNVKQNFLKNFQWDISGQQWEKYFDSVKIRSHADTWLSKPDIKPIPNMPTEEQVNGIFKDNECAMAEFLILNVLQKPSLLNSELMFRLQKDLHFGFVTESTASGGYYMNDSSMIDSGMRKKMDFNFQKAFEFMASQRQQINQLEHKRMEKFDL